MSTVHETDALLVNRDGVTYQAQVQNLRADVDDDDLLLVNRGDRTFTITGKDLLDSILAPAIVKPTITQPLPTDTPEPFGVSFVGSEFESTTGDLVAASADWQVALATDTSYSNPVSQVIEHPEMAPFPNWVSGEIAELTEFRARTRYRAQGGYISEWSDDVVFTTDRKVPNTLKQSAAYRISAGNVLTEMNSPVEFINMGSRAKGAADQEENIAIGTDGFLYYATETSTTFVRDTSIPYDNLAQYWHCYGMPTWFGIQQDGTFVTNEPTWNITEKIDGFFPLGSVCRVCMLRGVSGQLYAVYDFSGNGFAVGDFIRPDAHLKGTYTFPRLPAYIADNIVDATAMFNLYDAQVIVILTNDGQLHMHGLAVWNEEVQALGFNGLGAEQTPVLQTNFSNIDFEHLYGLTTYSRVSGFTALDSNNNLWFAGDASNEVTGAIHRFGIWGSGYKSGFVNMYQSGGPHVGAYALRTNGEIWGNIGNVVTSEDDWVKIDVGGYVTTLGGLSGNQNSFGIPSLIPRITN